MRLWSSVSEGVSNMDYQDSHRALVANRALDTVKAILALLENEQLTHRQRNHVNETIQLITAAALKVSRQSTVVAGDDIPF